MVNVLVRWPRAREGVPFNAEEHNQIINFLQGYLAAPFTLVQVGGNAALDWNPQTDLFTFNASAILNASVTLGNTIWLEGFQTDDTTKVNLIRVNGSNIIELGASDQRMSIGAALTNNTKLGGRNAANSATITLVKLNTSDIVEVGEAGQQTNLMGTANVPTALQANGSSGTSSQVWHGGSPPSYGSVVTADIAADAVTQVLSPTPTTSTPNTTSTSYTTIDEMQQGFTATGGKIVARFTGVFYNSSGANNATIALRLDSDTEVAASERTVSLAAGSLAQCVATEHVFTGVSAGAHAIYARWKTNGGTLNNLLLQRSLTVTEIKR